MKKVFSLIFLFLPFQAYAQQAPFAYPDIPITGRDRVYAADQTSNTVSVIDPSNNTMLGVIRLGNPVPASLSPLYRAQLLVHGMGYSPDSKTVAVVSVASNSVTLIDTATNAVKGTVYVGRSPHEAFFTPDGSELWIRNRSNHWSAKDARSRRWSGSLEISRRYRTQRSDEGSAAAKRRVEQSVNVTGRQNGSKRRAMGRQFASPFEKV